MKQSNSTQNALGAFKKLGAVALITATMFFTACNQAVGGNSGGGGGKPTPTPTPTKYTVTLNQTANGTVTSSPEIPADKLMPKDTIITFTATAKAGYKIGKWTVTGSALEAGTGADESPTAKVKITADTQVSVSFEAIPKHAINFSVDSTTQNGTLKAVVSDKEIDSGNEVEEGKTVIFTATANTDYRVKEWKVNDKVVTGNKTNTYKHTVTTQNANIIVSFEAIPKHAINFSVEGANGTLKAKSDGVPETSTSPITVEEDKTVTFTAEPSTNYRVKEWKVGDTVVTGNKTNTYTHTVKKAVTVKVSFERIPEGAILTLAADKKIVAVTAKTEDNSAITVEGCTVNTLTSDNQTDLQANANGGTITLKGNIIELHVTYNFPLVGPLTALDVSGLSKLQKLYCGGNQLTSLNASGLTALKEIKCYSNKLTELNVQGCTALQKLECSSNNLPELNVQGLTALQELSCPNNKLTELDVRGLIVLKNLRCNQNKLNSLKVKGLTALEELNCFGNNLTELDVQGLTKLQKLECEENQLAKLNASGLTELKEINCNDNQLTKLNVQGCTALKSLYCRSNKLDAEAMKALLNALPQREASEDPSASAVALLYTEETGKPEGNYKDFNKPATPAELQTAFDGAKSRNWKLRKVNAGGWDYVDI